MPELPEVEVLVRSLEPQLRGQSIRHVEVLRPRLLRPTSALTLRKSLTGARICGLSRRGKYLLFTLWPAAASDPVVVLGHLGMTGRMYLLPARAPLPRHAVVVLHLGRQRFVFEDSRGFGRFTLDAGAIGTLGPEALGEKFTVEYFAAALRRFSQPIKVKLLDQELVAGIGNIYASESLFRAGLSPLMAARRLKPAQVEALWKAIREVLKEAIAWGSTVRLDFPGALGRNRLFYFGSHGEAGGLSPERLRVYDHAGEPCPRCGAPIRHLTQAARSTYYCPRCQRPGRANGGGR